MTTIQLTAQVIIASLMAINVLYVLANRKREGIDPPATMVATAVLAVLLWLGGFWHA